MAAAVKAAPPAAPSGGRIRWRGWLPGSLYGQVLAALLAGLLAAQLIGAWIVLGDRAAFAERMAGGHAAQRIAAMLGALDHTTGPTRGHVLRALDLPPTRLSLDDVWAAPAQAPGEAAMAFEAEMRAALQSPLSVQVLTIQRDSIPRPRNGGGSGGGGGVVRERERENGAASPLNRMHRVVLRVVLQARLTDGTVVTVRQALPSPPGEQPLRLLGWLAAVMLIMAALAAWIVRRLTRPLDRFAAAAMGLARDLDQPPLPESGPREIGAAAVAFNHMQRDLRQLLDSRGQALAAVSHDLRLPLTRVRLRLEALPEAPLRQAIETDLVEMDRMIGNTLDFLRAGRSRELLTRLDLDALVDSVANDLEPLGAQINIHGRSGPPIMARPQALTRALANVLDNARRYGAPLPVDVELRDRGDCVEVVVMDRGPGIAEHDRDRVFEPYVRLESSRAHHTGGTGLGLAIARAVARSHGGDVTLTPRDGGGVMASICLPRTPLT